MKRAILISLFLITCTAVTAQLKGSGNVIRKTFPYKGFDKVYFEDLAGTITVEIGKPYSITIAIDDNLEELLAFKTDEKEHALTLFFKGNKNNVLYIENTHIKINITMPEASVISNNGNTDLIVKNIKGRYFRLENLGNGDSTISGTIDLLDVTKNGNGNVNSSSLFAKKAKIESSGNGDVTVNVSDTLTATTAGNSNVKNSGKAKFDAASTSKGNGKLINQRN